MTSESSAEDALIGALLEDLEPLDPAVRPMFGGYCIYGEQTLVAIVYDGRAYLWIPEADRTAWQEDGSTPFTSPHGQTLHAYHQIPTEVLTDPNRILHHARAAVQARRHD